MKEPKLDSGVNDLYEDRDAFKLHPVWEFLLTSVVFWGCVYAALAACAWLARLVVYLVYERK